MAPLKDQLFSLVIFVTFSMGIAIASYLNRSISQTYALRIWDSFRCKNRISDDLKKYIRAPENDKDDCRVSVTRGTNIGEEQPTLTLYMYWQRSSSTLRRYVHNCNSDESHLNIILKCKISDTASLHEMCLVDGNCDKQGTFCGMEKDYGRCICKEGYRVDSSRRKCIRVNVLLGGHCVHNANCGELNTWCRGNRCKCRDGYSESNGFCITGNIKLGETCFSDIQCGQSQICSKTKCSCRAGYVQIENICVKGRKALGSSCQYHQQCTETPSASLCLGNASYYRCSCDMGFLEKNRTCIENIKLGGTCFSDLQCGQSQICSNKICSCRAGYVQIENICVEGRKALGFSCQYHQQCTGTPKASLCLGNASHYWCSCDIGFIEKYQTCIVFVK